MVFKRMTNREKLRYFSITRGYNIEYENYQNVFSVIINNFRINYVGEPNESVEEMTEKVEAKAVEYLEDKYSKIYNDDVYYTSFWKGRPRGVILNGRRYKDFNPLFDSLKFEEICKDLDYILTFNPTTQREITCELYRKFLNTYDDYLQLDGFSKSFNFNKLKTNIRQNVGLIQDEFKSLQKCIQQDYQSYQEMLEFNK